MADVELADELAELVGQLKTQLGRHYAAGTWAAPGGVTSRVESAAAIDAAASDVVASELAGDVVSGTPELIDEPIVQLGRRTLPEIRAELGNCTRCKLHTTRNSIVFGVGDANAPLMFVGEAPGEQEDKRGEPFVGPAGELLDKMIEAMGWSRQSVYINNILACRPPGNRNPQPDEVAACKPFLEARIGAIGPRIIVALGRPAANTLLGTDAPISSLRGKFHDRHGIKVMPTFHPAYLLREPDRKRDTWADLKLVIAELARLGIQSPRPPRV
jgi:uracil-DNA glycosylase family 4